MKGYLYNRTAYCSLSITIPQFFVELEDCFQKRFTGGSFLTNPTFTLTENLCRRMADVEFYASHIDEEQKRANTYEATASIGTLLVGYFSACKSLLDAGAITLAKIYMPNKLSNREMDFAKPFFWTQLNQANTIVCKRYLSFKGLSDNIIDWRDAAVHRLTPLVIVTSPGPPEKTPRDKIEINMVAQPDAEVSTIVKAPKNIKWVEPLHFPKKWHSQLLSFCKEVCSDIRGQTFSIQP